MKTRTTKIVLFIALTGFFTSCNSVKRLAKDDHLLNKNTIYVNDKNTKTEAISNFVYQRPNKTLLGYPLRLHIYNLARPNMDSILNSRFRNPKNPRDGLKRFLSEKQFEKFIANKKGFNTWLKKTGEAPTVLDTAKIRKSEKRLEAYYWNNGWFNVKTTSKTEYKGNKRAQVSYFVNTGNPFILDTITTNIESPVLDSIYKLTKEKSIIKTGDQYKSNDFKDERTRLTNTFRNSGVYFFSQDYVGFKADTIGTNNKVNVDLNIGNRSFTDQDSTRYKPFKIYKIKNINIFTDNSYNDQGKQITDSVHYKGLNFYSIGKMLFRPKALADAIFITPKEVFKVSDRTQTYNYISQLRTFKYPNITYLVNADTTLTSNIYLTPLKKFSLGFSAEVTQSNIQSVGLSFNPSLRIRNIFRGAETLEISGFASIGASKDASDSKDAFFDITEIGADLKLTFPRLFFLFNTEKIIPKYMSPFTTITLSATSQTNIGLDKQTFTGTFNYSWKPSYRVTHKLDLFNVQYVRNLNPDNYFNVYNNSFNSLSDIAVNTYTNTPSNYIQTDANGNQSLIQSEANNFIKLVLDDAPFRQSNPTSYQTVSNISDRENRLTENNLIFATSFNYILDKRETLFDSDFSLFRAKIESAGNFLKTISDITGLQKNNNGRFELFNVSYSQYIKTELDYIKHWSLGRQNELAYRTFFGFAIPYGNSSNIPFSKSFFAGGPNDNRAWSAYNLGPGTSSSANEFNEANLKIATNLEYRYNFFGNLNGAFFIDAGNIWNALDDEADADYTFKNFSSLKDIAIGSGFGLRYNFGYFVLRGDIGFKTYDPSYKNENRWFNTYNFAHAVYNIGINYPF